jgi:hypothetical protein
MGARLGVAEATGTRGTQLTETPGVEGSVQLTTHWGFLPMFAALLQAWFKVGPLARVARQGSHPVGPSRLQLFVNGQPHLWEKYNGKFK